MSAKVIIFDFDGTIADSYDKFVAIANKLALEFNYPTVSLAQAEGLKNLSSREIVNLLDISLLKIPIFWRRFKQELQRSTHDVNLFPGIADCLIQLKQRGYKLGIITSNYQASVVNCLQQHQVLSLFDFIYSGTSLFGKHRVIRQVIKQYKLSPASVVYVGDETRDIKAAKRSKIRVCSVTWGFNSIEVLSRYYPHYVVDRPSEILDLFKGDVSITECDRVSQLV